MLRGRVCNCLDLLFLHHRGLKPGDRLGGTAAEVIISLVLALGRLTRTFGMLFLESGAALPGQNS